MLRTTDGFAGRCGLKVFGGQTLPWVYGKTAKQTIGRTIGNGIAFADDMSVPNGYNVEYAIAMPVKTSGQIAARVQAEGANIANLIADGNMSASLEAEGELAANGNVLANGYAAFAGEGDFIADIRAQGNMTAVVDIGARPSAFDVSQAVWFGTTFDGIGANKVMEVLLAVAAGKTNVDTSGASPVVTFRDTSDTIDRVVATMDGSERTNVTIS